MTRALNKKLYTLIKAYQLGTPVTFNYRAEKSSEKDQKPVIKILDVKITKKLNMIISGVNLNRITDETQDVRSALRSYRVERIVGIPRSI